MRSFRFALVVVGCACGARTDLGGVVGATDGGTACNAAPWVVFDYLNQAESGIAAMRSDGSLFHMLNLGGMRGWDPSVSPDGSKLFYVVSPDESHDSLMILDLATQTTRTFVSVAYQPPSGGLGKAAMSPDGKLVAYGFIPDLRLATIDDQNDHVLIPGPYNAGCCPWSYGHPVFSPDSQTIYFSTIGILESIHTDGTGLQMLEQDQFFANPSIPGFSFPNVSLSPDGTELVAQVACDVAELRIFKVGVLPGDPCTVGTKLVEVEASEASNEASNPSWGPTQIVYDNNKDLFLIDPTGGTPQNLTQSVTTGEESFASDPVWAPACAELP